LIKTVLTIAGGVVAATITGRLTRKSQKESAHILALTNLVDQLQEERDKAKADVKQVPLWRRYAQKLRSQIYKLGGEPHEADAELEL
jgi:2-phosphoglycerate kinase